MEEIDKLIKKTAKYLYSRDYCKVDVFEDEIPSIQIQYCNEAKQFLFGNNLWLKIGESEGEWVCDAECIKHWVKIPVTIPLEKE